MSAQVVACVAEATTAAVLARMREAAPWCGLLELRLDAAAPGGLDLEGLLRLAPAPVLATCRPAREGGAWRGDEGERLALLARAAAHGAAWVDVEWDAVAALPPLPATTRVLVSRHVLTPPCDPAAVARGGRPAPAGARDAAARAAARAAFEAEVDALLASLDHPRAAAGKLAVAVRGADEALALLARAARAPRPTAAVALGEAGRVSRLAGPRWGAPFVYAAAAAAVPTGPGQLAARDLARLLEGRTVSPATALFGILGRPVATSRSPWLMNAAFAALGLDAVYAWLEADDPHAVLDALDADPLARGLSVTMPHKVAAADWLRARGGRASAAVLATGALNTLAREGDGWAGENTDAVAAEALLAEAGVGPGAPVTLLGTGGAARAVGWAAARLGAALTVFGRDPAAGRALAERLAPLAAGRGGGARFGGPLWDVPAAGRPGPGAPGPGRVVVNATSVGHAGDPHAPVPADVHGPGTVAYDLVHTPAETPFLAQARARGARVVTGVEHFARQARAQLAAFVGEGVAARLDDAWFTAAVAAVAAGAVSGASSPAP